MTKLATRLEKRMFPLYNISKIRYGKLKLRHGKRGVDVRIEVEYGLSEWLRAKSDYMWIGDGEHRLKLRGTNDEKVESIKKRLKRGIKVQMRIPELEKRKDVQKTIRKERKKMKRTMKRW